MHGIWMAAFTPIYTVLQVIKIMHEIVIMFEEQETYMKKKTSHIIATKYDTIFSKLSSNHWETVGLLEPK
jgi:hypothetical protein